MITRIRVSILKLMVVLLNLIRHAAWKVVCFIEFICSLILKTAYRVKNIGFRILSGCVTLIRRIFS